MRLALASGSVHPDAVGGRLTPKQAAESPAYDPGVRPARPPA